MAEDFDVEEMLEAAYKKEDTSSRHDEKEEKKRESSSRRRRSKSRSKSRERRSSRDRHRDRDRERDRDRDRDRDRERDRDRDRDRHRRRDRSRDRDRDRRDRYRDRGRHNGLEVIDRYERERQEKERNERRERRKSMSLSPIRNPRPEMTPEERDARTVFCMQLAARIRPRDLEEFFSSVGKVREVRIITDNKTRRSKGIAYIEFEDIEPVTLALGLTGQRLLGVPILVQASQAEKNRLASGMTTVQRGNVGPMRLYVGSLHFNISEEMLKGIFEPFGKIVDVKLMKDHDTNKSQGYGFITYQDSEDAKKALDQLNGFELAGRPMKVGHVNERAGEIAAAGGGPLGSIGLDTDHMDRAGIDLGATGRLQLMAKLAEGTGFQIPDAAAHALSSQPPNIAPTPQATATPPIATQCFMLSNMFDPTSESNPTWDSEIRDDVIEECNKHGGVLHIFVDKASTQGNVYVKCPTISAAVASVGALHGRWFAGKVITAAYVPLPNYHQLFPNTSSSSQLMLTTAQASRMGVAVPVDGAPPSLPYTM